jgi:hypothetical protein
MRKYGMGGAAAADAKDGEKDDAAKA